MYRDKNRSDEEHKTVNDRYVSKYKFMAQVGQNRSEGTLGDKGPSQNPPNSYPMRSKTLDKDNTESAVYLGPNQGDTDEPLQDSFVVSGHPQPKARNRLVEGVKGRKEDESRRDSVLTYSNDTDYMRRIQFEGLAFL